MQENIMKSSDKTLWQILDELSHQLPFSKKRIETVLSTQLSESDKRGNDIFLFYMSPPVNLADGIVISNVDLRLKREGSHPGFLVLEIEGAHITGAQVRKHYDHLKITDFPRGRSPEEATVYSQDLPWGRLSFGFKERNRDCLASVSFHPNIQ
jgi:hypothetical protein